MNPVAGELLAGEWAAAIYAAYAPLPDLWCHCFGREVYRCGNPAYPQVSLTFDDGPDPRYTPCLLQTLEEARVKATFFLIGQKVRRYPDLVKDILDHGHEIGNHTYHHLPSWLLTPWATRREVLEGERIIRQVAGIQPPFFRPPWGLFNLFMYGLKSKPVLWSVVARDWNRRSNPLDIARRVVRLSKPGSIILLHDAGGAPGAPYNTLQAIPLILAGLAQKGLQPVPLGQLLSPVAS